VLVTIAKELDDFYRRIGGGLVRFLRSKTAPMNELSEQEAWERHRERQRLRSMRLRKTKPRPMRPGPDRRA
jgi:hypothetical protein